MTQKLIIATNRAPVTNIYQGPKKLTIGGLVSAMHGIAVEREAIWIFASDDNISNSYESPKALGYTLKPVNISKKDYKFYYEGYSNSLIWPLFHYFPSKCLFDEENWTSYKKVNETITNKIAQSALENPDASIWIHDYHLLLAANLLRQQGVKNKISFFLHIPFPTFEIFRLLPQREEILRSLLANDLIGFHTKNYVTNFFRCVRNFIREATLNEPAGYIEYQNHRTYIKDFPISIDAKAIQKLVHRSNKRPHLNQHSKVFDKDLKIGLGVDRLDYTKGIYERLQAIDYFFKKNPKYRHQMTFIQIAVPSRGEVPDYQTYKFNCEQLISSINGQYGNLDWQPILYINKSIPFEQLVEYYKLADFALITPLRDGMNLVAKEFIIARKTNAALILSEMAGAAEEFKQVATVNPYHKQQIANMIKYCLEHPGYQKQSLDDYEIYLHNNSVQKWAYDFITTLEKSCEQLSLV